MAAPDVSVVIPSSRGARLAFALEALAAQTLASERFEVIVVRDAAAPPAPPFPAGLRGRLIEARGSANVAQLRNLGWRAAAAPLVAFTDDDCRPAPDWLEQLLGAARPMTLVQGRTEPDPDEIHLLHGLARSQRIVAPTRFFQTCNLLVPRAMIAAAGGFDERFAPVGDDTDLAWRLIEAGARPAFCERALVHHAVIPRSLKAALREATSRDAVPALVARHQALRGGLFLRLFSKRPHALLLLAALGLAVARRRPLLGVAIAAPYVNGLPGQGQGYGPRALVRRLVHLPAKLALDGTEVLASARASLRERTLVL